MLHREKILQQFLYSIVINQNTTVHSPDTRPAAPGPSNTAAKLSALKGRKDDGQYLRLFYRGFTHQLTAITDDIGNESEGKNLPVSHQVRSA